MSSYRCVRVMTLLRKERVGLDGRMTDLNTVHNVEHSVSLKCYVTCREPSIAERILGGLLVAEIALCHDRATNKELSGCSNFNVLRMSVKPRCERALMLTLSFSSTILQRSKVSRLESSNMKNRCRTAAQCLEVLFRYCQSHPFLHSG